jgi:hypothetical protein
MNSRQLSRRAFLLCVSVLVCAPSVAQSRAPPKEPAHAAGRAVQHAVKVPFVAAPLNDKGWLLAHPPESLLPEGPEHVLSKRARAEKALANARKAPNTPKPAPRSLTGKALEPPGRHGRPPNTGASSSSALSGISSPTVPTFPTSIGGALPPDVAMAAGPNEIVTANNSFVNVYDKSGNLLGPSLSLNSFFAGLGSLSSWAIFDPVVHYDEYLKRFWLTAAACPNNSSPLCYYSTPNQSDVLIALSNGPDPTNGWSVFGVNMTLNGNSASGNWCDYPRLGLDTRAIYITCNMFEFSDVGNLQYGKVRVMAKSQFVDDTCCSWDDHWNLPPSLQPAIMRGAKDSDGEFLVEADGEGGSGDTLGVFHFPDPIHDPGQLDVAGGINVSGYYTPPDAQQPGIVVLWTVDTRLLFAIWQNGTLATAQNTDCDGFNCAAYYELNVSSFPSVSVINDWALQQGGIDYYFPSVDVNNNGDKTMVYTYSQGEPGPWGPTVLYTGIPNSHRCTNCIGDPAGSPGTSGGSQYNDSASGSPPVARWGDYLTAAADPDGLGIWIAGETPASTTTWGILVSPTYNSYAPAIEFSPSALTFPTVKIGTSAALNITLTNSGNADLTIDSAQINGSSDFSILFNTCKIASPLGVGVLETEQSCAVTVLFTPTASGEAKAALQVCDSAQGPTCIPSLDLSGNAGQVQITGSGVQTTIKSLNPKVGSVLGGITVTAMGEELNDKLTFDFGGSPATMLACNGSSTSCTMTIPPHSPGTVDVTYHSSSGTVVLDQFTYQAPVIKGISPSVGPTVGGESVQLTGVGFGAPMTVNFGSAPPIVLACYVDDACGVMSPPGVGQVHITATVSGYTSPETSADLYTYAIFPTVTGITPDSGPATGGNRVTVNGTNFNTAPGGTVFMFGTLAPTNVTCTSSMVCMMTVPVRPPGSTFLRPNVTATVDGHTSLEWVGYSFGTLPPRPTPPPCKGPDCG